MNIRVLCGLLFLAPLLGCDRPTPSPTGPPPGIIRLSPGALPPEISKEPAYRASLPSLGLKVEYSGPKPALRIEGESFEKGESRNGSTEVRVLSLPLQGDLGFGFGVDKDSKGTVLSGLVEVFVTRPSSSEKLTTRKGGSSQRPATSIRSEGVQLYEPKWPLEIADGQEAVVWGVFVGEPAGDRKAVPLTDRVKEAEAAWLFKVSSAEKPKE